ncbi:MAG: NAD(P)-binding domain-containing protein [Bacteroidales bacterium]|nr:NAD(P)-binding domain-containing protein [Bacteroidales bacterium]
MEILFEEIGIYGFALLLVVGVIFFYLRKQKRESNEVDEKINQAKVDGIHEPVSLYPVVDPNRCIKSGACITACPEKDILGIRNGRATTINASHCIGHGACFRACPMEAISLWIGTEKRGVDLPHVTPSFETNVPGVYIAGELGGMGLIKNAVTQGFEAVENISKTIKKSANAKYDLIVVGAGPAGISASLAAKKFGLTVLTLEQDTLGGTVFTFPRSKIVMTAPMNLPLYGKVKFRETTKTQLLDIWHEVLSKHDIKIQENSKVEEILPDGDIFYVTTSQGEKITASSVLLTIGRRGTPRKLGVIGEDSEKVAYRLLEPELISNKKILVVGGGDSAIESALLLADQNKVTLSYRSSAFSRIKPKNAEKINEAIQRGLIDVKFNTNLVSIEPDFVAYKEGESDEIHKWENDMVYIFAGGELPTQFLKKIGIEVSTKRGEAFLKHDL